MYRVLAESNKYKVVSEYEYATLVIKGLFSEKRIEIGEFYGDPKCALISKNERYVVVAGEGLIIYWLKKPYDDCPGDSETEQFVELFRDESNLIWIDVLSQEEGDVDWDYFRCVTFLDEEKVQLLINVNSLTIIRV